MARHVWSRVIVPPDFFDSALLRVTIVTINRGQSAEVSSRMVSAKTHVATKCVAACVMFFSCFTLCKLTRERHSYFPVFFLVFFFVLFVCLFVVCVWVCVGVCVCAISMVLSVVIDMSYPYVSGAYDIIGLHFEKP